MSEEAVKRRIMLSLGREARLFTNPVGTGWMGKVVHRTADTVTLANPRQVSFGLFKGSADLIGWRTIAVTPEMVGQRIAAFLSIEVKDPSGKAPRPDQIQWADVVRDAGGLSGIARSPDQARLIARLTP